MAYISSYRARGCAVVSLLLGSALHAAALNIGGYVLWQTNDYRSYTIPSGTTVAPGGYVVIGRNATKGQFETNWGVTLGTNVVYLNASNSFPKMSGDERYRLLNAGGTNIDGWTFATNSTYLRSAQRRNATNNPLAYNSWNVVSYSAGTPGSGGSGVTSNGLVISEFTDDASFSFEFVELYCSASGTASNTPPVLQAIPNKTITVSNNLQFAVVATPTDTNLVTLSVSNNPPGSILASTNESGTFLWTNPAPIGVYTTKFYAANKWGADCKTVTVSVLDLPTAQFVLTDYTAGEDVGTQSVQVVLSRPADATIQVAIAGTAITNWDFSVSSTAVVFSAAGSTQVSFSVVISNDNVSESTEYVHLTLTNPASARIGAPGDFTLYIRDNDGISIMTANLVTGSDSKYNPPGCRILQGLKPDIVGIQEWNITNVSYRDFVDVNFGTNFSYYIEPQSTNYFPLPNGIISRWPIKASGEWADPVVVNRDFAWATVDIPGDRDLHVVSVHLYSSGTAADRETEARYITNYVRQAGWPSNDYIVICGDMNTEVRSEPAIAVFTNLFSDEHKPVDQTGTNYNSNSTRKKPFDYVLPGPSLNSNNWSVVVGGLSFSNGLVFDSRLWTNPPTPILTNDSAVVNADHMAVMKSFSLGKTPPSLQPIGSRSVLDHNTLQFEVQALQTDGDSYTLFASNLPPGAVYLTVTNTAGTFLWTNAAPIGSYTSSFYAADIDGVESESVLIKVLVDGNIWINELHYDNTSTDTNEGVEIAGTAGMDLSFYSVCAYNGGDGTIYMSNSLSGYLDDEGCGYGAVWIPMDGLQNGPDAIALVRDGTNILQFLSYEGSFVAVDGPAVELTAVDLGPSEAGTELAGLSLQLTGEGTNYDAFSWAGPTNAASPGAMNSRQIIYPCGLGSNQPPVLYVIGDKSIVLSNALAFGVTASDNESDPITLSVSNAPAGSTFGATNGNGTFTWASPAPIGVYTCTFYAAGDDGVDFETIRITVASGTEPPVLQSMANKTVIQGRPLSFDVIATDAENDPISLTASNLPAGSSFSATNGSGSFAWTNPTPTGVYTARFYAVDDDGSDSSSVKITVTPPTNLPAIQSIAGPWVLAGNTLAFNVTATDADGDAITLTVSNKPAGASFSASAGDGVFTWINASPVGIYTSTFYAADNDGTVSQTVAIHVLLNGALWINEVHYDNSGTDTNEGVEIAGTAGIDLSYYVLYAYNGNDGLIYASNGLAGTIDDEGCGYGAAWFPMSGLQNGPDGIALVLDGSNVVQFLSYGGTITASNGPAAGLVSDNIKVYESASPTNCSVQLTGVGTSYVQFAWAMPTNAASTNRLNDRQYIYPCGGGTNQPPFLYAIGNKAVGLSNTLSFTVGATDVDNDTITLSVSNAPAGSSFTATNGAFVWTNALPIGIYTSTFYAVDKNGADQETVLITVYSTATNPPTLQAISNRTVVEHVSLAFAVVATEPDGDVVALSVSNAPAGATFSATNGNGWFNWADPTPLGAYTTTFYAVDKDGVDLETIAITVGAGTNPPVLQAIGNRSVTVNNTLTFAVTATDADNDTITLSISNAPAGSILSATNGYGTFRWTNASPIGVYTTAFYATDNDGADSETVTVTVAAGVSIWINEIHYDNSGTDSNEGVEVAGTAGIDLSAYALLGYNGGDGKAYMSNTLSGTIDDEGCGYGAVWFAMSGLQNGPSDAVALAHSGDVVQFLSYEGVMTATSGPAAGITATDLGVSEAGLETNRSLQLRGTGAAYAQFVWAGPTNLQSAGLLNAGQILFPCPGDSDTDGLPNDWESVYFGGATNAIATDDADTDGMDNMSEYIAGTVPTNSLSIFTADAVQTNASPYVHFDSVTNRLYNLYYRTNLSSGGWDPWLTNIAGNGATISVVVTNLPEPTYFRPTVRLP